MKALLLLALFQSGGDQDRGLELYQQGNYPEAAEAFQRAIDNQGDSPELSYNLALSLWRAGDPDGAETAAERAATLSDGDLAPLRDGLLGALRYDLARELGEQDLATALGLAEQSLDHFLRGGLSGGTPELHRNLERAQKLVDELQEKLEEQQQEQQQEQEQEQDPEEEEEQQEQEQEQEQRQDQQDQEQQQGDEEQQEQEQQEGEEQPQDDPQEPEDSQEPRNDAPGESEPTELSPEQKQRMMDQLEEMEDALRQLRALQQSSRPRVRRDW